MNSYIFIPENNQAIILKTDRKSFGLKELQSLVGGYIEVVAVTDNIAMIINEEGKIKNLPVNDEATRIYPNPIDVICGPAVIVKSEGEELVPFSEDEFFEVREALRI